MLRNELYRPWFEGKEDWGFEIIDGEFSGVVVQISKVEFLEDATTEDNLSAEFHTIHKPEHITQEDINGDLFKSCFQLIITDIITEAIDNFKTEVLKDEDNDKNRNNDSKESDTQ